MFRKHHEKRIREYTEFVNAVLPAGACLVSFKYFSKLFEDDFKIEIAHNGSKHIFCSVKGWIYHNDELICDSGYHYLEKESTFGKILKVIKQALT
jgi:hypothetical protein